MIRDYVLSSLAHIETTCFRDTRCLVFFFCGGGGPVRGPERIPGRVSLRTALEVLSVFGDLRALGFKTRGLGLGLRCVGFGFKVKGVGCKVELGASGVTRCPYTAP